LSLNQPAIKDRSFDVNKVHLIFRHLFNGMNRHIVRCLTDRRSNPVNNAPRHLWFFLAVIRACASAQTFNSTFSG
jgi:hypothetical protein